MRSAVRPLNFEEVYSRYEFAPLVNLAMIIAAWIKSRSPTDPRSPGTPASMGHPVRIRPSRKPIASTESPCQSRSI